MRIHAGLLLQVGICLLAGAVPLLASLVTTPEPATIALIGGGLGVLILIARPKRTLK